jgi:hypothetical protein
MSFRLGPWLSRIIGFGDSRRPHPPGRPIRPILSLHRSLQKGLAAPARLCCGPLGAYDAEKRTMSVSVHGLSASWPDHRISVIMWIQNVQHFTDVAGAVNMFYSTWTSELNLTLVALIAFYVELFFCHRLWVSTSNHLGPVLNDPLGRQYRRMSTSPAWLPSCSFSACWPPSSPCVRSYSRPTVANILTERIYLCE